MTHHCTPSVLTQHIFSVSLSPASADSPGKKPPSTPCESVAEFPSLELYGKGPDFPWLFLEPTLSPRGHLQGQEVAQSPCHGDPSYVAGSFLESPGSLCPREAGASFKGINLVKSASPSQLTQNLLTWELNHISTLLAFCYPVG